MDFAKLKLTDSIKSEVLPKCTTKPIYGKKTLLWEIENIESVMADGVQRAMSCDFEVRPSPQNNNIISRWRLTLDLVDIEPAVTVEKLGPLDKMIFYRIAIHVMKSSTEETDIISFPNAQLFYDAVNYSDSNCRNKDFRKFTLHKQLDYGCSYSVWFKDTLLDGSLLLKVDFETCESITC